MCVWPHMSACRFFFSSRRRHPRFDCDWSSDVCSSDLFTGATAGIRGRDGFSAFAGAKHALRALAQSMARELGPQGIHVAHVVIDGAIDTEFIRSNFPDRAALKDRDGILDPEAIAEAYWQLHCQPRSAWTHEMDL